MVKVCLYEVANLFFNSAYRFVTSIFYRSHQAGPEVAWWRRFDLPRLLQSKNWPVGCKAWRHRPTFVCLWSGYVAVCNKIQNLKGLNPGVISKVGWVRSSGWTLSWIGLLLLTVTDVSTTYAVVIFRGKVNTHRGRDLEVQRFAKPRLKLFFV